MLLVYYIFYLYYRIQYFYIVRLQEKLAVYCMYHVKAI